MPTTFSRFGHPSAVTTPQTIFPSPAHAMRLCFAVATYPWLTQRVGHVRPHEGWRGPRHCSRSRVTPTIDAARVNQYRAIKACGLTTPEPPRPRESQGLGETGLAREAYQRPDRHGAAWP